MGDIRNSKGVRGMRWPCNLALRVECSFKYWMKGIFQASSTLGEKKYKYGNRCLVVVENQKRNCNRASTREECAGKVCWTTGHSAYRCEVCSCIEHAGCWPRPWDTLQPRSWQMWKRCESPPAWPRAPA